MKIDLGFIKSELERFADELPLAVQIGGDYIRDSEIAQSMAVYMVVDMFENIAERNEDEFIEKE